MKASGPVSMDENSEMLDDQNCALSSTSSDDERLAQDQSGPSLAVPVGSRVNRAIVDNLSSSSNAEDWLKIAQINQENMIGTAGHFDGMADNMDAGQIGAASLKGLQDQIMGAALPEALRVSGYVSDLAASMDKALIGAASLKGLQDQIMGAALPEALRVPDYVCDLAASMDKALIGAASLKGLQNQVMGAALPEALRVPGYVSDLAASMDTTLIEAAGLQRLQDQMISAALPADLGLASFVSDVVVSVNTTAAWAEILQKHRNELFRIDDRLMRHVSLTLESLKPRDGLYLNDDERFAACCMKLAQRGWFLDPQMPMSLLWHLADTIEESPEEADVLLVQWFQERLDEIEEELVKTCPKRAHVLRSAFNAHRERDYNNSVPAVLKEADGMWHDIFGMNVFRVRERASIVKSIEQKQPYGLISTSLVPLLQSTLPLWMNESERHNWMKQHRTDSFPELNRHEVLHGLSVEYGTETNSLKAISFLNWRLLVELVV